MKYRLIKKTYKNGDYCYIIQKGYDRSMGTSVYTKIPIVVEELLEWDDFLTYESLIEADKEIERIISSQNPTIEIIKEYK